MIQKYFVLLLCFLWAFNLSADSPAVKSITMTMDPMIASMQRLDANGNVCGLVKVILPNANVSFEGNLIGGVEFKTSEYWCYLSPNTRFLKIKYPGLEPLMLDFYEYFDKGIQSKRIYEITISLPSSITKSGYPISLEIEQEEPPIPYHDDLIIKTINPRGGYKNPNWRIGDYSLGKIQVFSEIINGEYDKMGEFDTHQFLINNVNKGDILTIVPENNTYHSNKIRISEEVIESQKLKINLNKKRHPIVGRICDENTNCPLEGVKILLYYLDDMLDFCWPSWTKDTICTTISNRQGYFEFPNCIIDYTYHIDAESSLLGYSGCIGKNVKPNSSDSLILKMRPKVFRAKISDGKQPICKAKISYLGLYDNETLSSINGDFEIKGIKENRVIISADGYKTLDLFMPYVADFNNLIIKLHKGDSNIVEYGVYDFSKEKVKIKKTVKNDN